MSIEPDYEWTVYTITERFLEEADGDREETTERIIDELRKPENKDILTGFLRNGIHKIIGQVIKDQRRDMLGDRDIDSREDNGDGLTALAKTYRESLLNYKLSSGGVLGDATKTEVHIETELHRKLRNTHSRRYEWFSRIESHLKDKQRVRDVFDHETLDGLYQEATAAAV